MSLTDSRNGVCIGFSAIAVIFAVSAPVFAQSLDLPPRKPGLWEMKMLFEGRQMPPMTAEHCIDADTDKLMQATGGQMAKDMCQQQNIQKSGATITVDSVCNIGGSKSTSHAVMTGDFNSAYTVKVDSKREGGGAMMAPAGDTRMTIEAKWMGPCKAGQKPGDIVMGNGMKMNIRDMPGMNAPAKRP